METDSYFSPSLLEKDISENLKAFELSEFPVSAFPAPIRDLINDCERTLNFPVDYLGSAILVASSIAVGSTRRVRVMPGFELAPPLYMALVGRPGMAKTHPVKFALGPIQERDKRAYEKFKQEETEYNKNKSLSKQERMKLGVQHLAPPKLRQTILRDYTPEALAKIHEDNQRGIGLMMDELVGWTKNFDRYNKGSEVEFWLSAFSEQSIVIDRKTSGSIRIERPMISVIGGIQPAILRTLLSEGRDKNGFEDRILFAMPFDLQKKPWNTLAANPFLQKRYYEIMERLLDIPDSEFKLLTLSANAEAALYKWQSELTDQVNESAESVGGALSKLDVYAPRFCLIMHMLRWACGEIEGEVIDEVTVDRALQLIRYYQLSLFRVKEYVSSSPLEKLPIVWREWYAALPSTEIRTAHAVEIAVMMGINERSAKANLSNSDLFLRTKHGEYKKTIST